MSKYDDKPRSFREAGTKLTGNLTRGNHRNLKTIRNDTKTCSIPSKVETTFNDTTGGPNAFWSRTQRFHEAENILPGPGSYHKTPSFVRSSNICGSVSQLGYGIGFVSKVNRFGERIRGNGPGPGQYNSDVFGSISARKSQSSTAIIRPARRMVSMNQAQPGPGDYYTPDSTFSSQSAACAAFSSKVDRSGPIRNDLPAPGQYEVGTPEKKLAINSVFRSKARRIEDLASKYPGPGAYNTEQAEICMRYDTIARGLPSAVFHKSVKDRFHTPHRREENTIGPGHYNISSNMKESRPTKWQSTRSESRERWSTDIPQDIPGPAYYRPSCIPKQSHYFNANGKWL